MGFREVKKELERIDKTEIIKLISEMYKNIPTVKSYLDIFVTVEIEQLASSFINFYELDWTNSVLFTISNKY